MKDRLFVPAAALALAGCGGGGSGVRAPDRLQGVWGADCAAPFVGFDGGRIHVYPDRADYDLGKAALNGANFDIAYDTPQGPIAETYVVEGDMLRLDRGTYGGQQAVWHKAPMKKCG
jgi:hypothetical protein